MAFLFPAIWSSDQPNAAQRSTPTPVGTVRSWRCTTTYRFVHPSNFLTTRHVVVGVELATDNIARFEFDEPVRPGTNWSQVIRCFARPRTRVVGEQMFWNNAAERADKGIGPKRGWLVEQDAYRDVIDLLDGNVASNANRHCGRRWVLGEFPIEHHVVGRKWLPVVPSNAGFELPRHRFAIRRQAAVLDGWNLGGQNKRPQGGKARPNADYIGV